MTRNTSRKTLVTLRLEEDLLAKFDAIAEKESRTRTGHLRWVMRRELEREAAASRTPPTGGEDATAA